MSAVDLDAIVAASLERAEREFREQGEGAERRLVAALGMLPPDEADELRAALRAVPGAR